MATQLSEAVVEEVTGITQDPQQAGGDGQDHEAKARLNGWRPQEEYDGPPEKWVDAETFNRRADENLGLSKAQRQHLEKRISILEARIKKLARAEQGAFEAGVASVKREMREAVASGDVEAYERAEAQLDQLQASATADAPAAHGEDPNEQFDSFRDSNPWYDKANLASASEVEISARLYADRLADKYAQQGLQKELSPSAFFAKIAEDVEAKYPTLKNKAPRPKPASDVAGVTRVAPNSRAKTGASLPPEAKRQAERFYNQGIIKGKNLAEALDNYAKSFDWSQ